MPGPPALSIDLCSQEHDILAQIVHAQTSEQRLVRRAQIILKAHEGFNNGHIAQTLNIRLGCQGKIWHSQVYGNTGRFFA